jgi:hypothetical protein
MGMAAKDNQSSIEVSRKVYNLDVIGNTTVPNLGLNMASITTAIGPSLQLATSVGAMLDAYFKPIREMVEAVLEFVKRIIQPMLDGLNAFIKPLTFLVSLKPIYYVPTQPVARERQLDKHLTIIKDERGFFVIGGKQLKILHPASSRCGRMFATLLERRAHTVSYEELQEEIGSGDLRKTFKDLKRQLKKEGYEFDYQLVRTKGIALLGLSSLQ